MATTLVKLARSYSDLFDSQTIKMLLERGLKIQEQHYGPDHFQVATRIVNSATAYGELGDPQMMKTLIERALKIDEQH